MPRGWRTVHTVGLVVIVVLIGVAGLLVPAESRRLGWFLTMGLFLAFLLVAGRGITGRWTGALIDDRNKMSLARLQLIVWTVVTLAAYLTAALGNIVAGLPDALAVAVPVDLWWLMGISTTSLVASPVLKAMKKTKQEDVKEWGRTQGELAAQGAPAAKADIDTQGLIVVNKTADRARFSDMFMGEETGNAAALDMAKVQMFLFTLILVLAYGASVATAMRVFPITELPDLSGGMVALLGISHAGYLTSKGAPHSATA